MEKLPDPFGNFEYLESELTRISERFYVDLPYHNFEHARDTLSESYRLAEYCETNGLCPDRRVLMASSLFHDAGFNTPLEEHGFRSKEEYSAFIAGQVLPDFGFSQQDTQHVQACIRSTERNVACQTLEAKILRRADLANVAGNMWGFMVGSRLLWEEAGKPVTIDAWLSNALTIQSSMQAYFDEDVSFGDFDRYRDMSTFLYNALSNLNTLHQINKDFAGFSDFWSDTFSSGKAFIEQVVGHIKKSDKYPNLLIPKFPCKNTMQNEK